MQPLEEKLGYTFSDKGLLRTALTHTSFANEKHTVSYERLEFLGDSILGYTVAEYLYAYRPELPEGRMTRLRAELVCESSLHEIAQRLNLGSYIHLGKGEEHSGGRERVSVLADIVEAIIAAIYLDSGLEQAKAFIYTQLLDGTVITEHKVIDYKSALQEYVQQNGPCTILYEEIAESGPDHNKTFEFRVVINGERLGEGAGRSKQAAEQAAAASALGILKS